MMDLTAITVPTCEISSSYIIIAKKGYDYIRPLFEIASLLEYKENLLTKKYFNDFLDNKNIIFQL